MPFRPVPSPSLAQPLRTRGRDPILLKTEVLASSKQYNLMMCLVRVSSVRQPATEVGQAREREKDDDDRDQHGDVCNADANRLLR